MERSKINSLRSRIILDCNNALLPAVLFNSTKNILCNGLSIYTNNALGKFTDSVFSLDLSVGIGNLKVIILCILLLGLVVPFMNYVGERLIFSNSLKHDRSVLKRFLGKYLIDIWKIDEGEAQYRLEIDPNELRLRWINISIGLISLPVIIIYLLYNVIEISIIFGVIVFFVLAFKLSVPVIVKKIRVRYDQQTREYKTKIRAYETEISTKPCSVKIYGLKDSLINRIDNLFGDFYKDTFVKKVKCNVLTDYINGFLDTFCILIILLIGSIMVAHNNITPGKVTTMVGYFSIFNSVIKSISSLINEFPIFNNIVNRMEVIYAGKEKTEGITINVFESIVAKNLSCAYENNSIFENINFNVKAGQKVAILGQNGSGKTTLINLICTANDNYSGSLKINNTEFVDLDFDKWRKEIAYVSQKPYLFALSVKENIRLCNPAASNEQIDEIMCELGIKHLSERKITLGNNTLSGGEKQRVEIARALVKDCHIILMDEPDNNLDDSGIEWLIEFIKKTKKTVFFVTHEHRLKDVAEKEIVLKNKI